MKLFVAIILSFCIVECLSQVQCPTFNGIEYPDIEGRCNNQQNPQWASQGATLLRTRLSGSPISKGGSPTYADGIGTMVKRERPGLVSVRDISNLGSPQPDSVRVCLRETTSDFATYFGQIMNHDMNNSPASRGINPPGSGPENAFIPIPPDDPYFFNYVSAIPFMRSDVVNGTGTSTSNPRQQFDVVTAYIDLSIVYCPLTQCNNLLREFAGGRMLMDPDQFNIPTEEYVCNFQANRLGQNPSTFLPTCLATLNIPIPNRFTQNISQVTAAGDKRVGENFGLHSLQQLWLLNHNYYANIIATANTGASDDEIFYMARSWNIAEFQNIVFYKYLPQLLGDYQPKAYTGYDPTIDASSNTEFVTAALRFGHSQISSVLVRRFNNGSYAGGDIMLRDSYFQGSRYRQSGGFPTIIQGMRFQKAQPVDLHVVDGLRQFLFGPGDASLGMDLVAINLQRGRDHGILSFNDVRRAYGLSLYTNFFQLTRNRVTANTLSSIYSRVNDCDLYFCGLAEQPHVKNGLIGQTFAVLIQEQMTRSRSGDRFYFENQCNSIFTPTQCQQIRQTKMEDIIGRFTDRPSYDPFLTDPSIHDRCMRPGLLATAINPAL